ncbi:anhydro-N-acetylmuramic acid kinase [Micromonospora chalcea]
MRIVGLMSGTSYDGVDVVAAEFTADGDTLRLRPLGHRELAYPDDLRAEIGALLPPEATTIEAVCRLDNRLGEVFAEAAAAGVELAGGAADAVVSPGQTVFHWVEAGRVRGTLQLGAPARVAARVGVPVLHDLRSADVAAGGQGAPLVPAFDALLLDPAAGPRAALNLGGIANLTVVAPGAPVLGYDVGPANALLDAAARRFLDRPCDVDGARAAAGRVHEALLARLLAEPYYAAPPPKSTGKELFHGGYLDAALAGLGGPVAADDVLATLTELTARIVADACDRHRVTEVVAAGGGVRNPTLRARLAALGEGRRRLRTTDELGVPAQAKEAYAFALLGWLSWHGLPGAVPSVTGASRAAVLGSWTPAGPSAAAPRPPAPRRLVVDA